jgi:hypothetical protein
MKILAIPDVHQTSYWKEVIQEIDNFDYIIQLGDWFDNWNTDWVNSDPIQNFQDAVDFSRMNPKFKICLGNHDISYLLKSHCSGYQFTHSVDIKEVLLKNIDYVNIAYEFDEWVFSHAGITKNWMKNHNFTSIQDINDALHRRDFEVFQFDGWDMYGDDISQGPTWVRPYSLFINAAYKYQVVGHTEMKESPYICTKEKFPTTNESIPGQKIIIIDDAEHICMYELDTQLEKQI